MDAERWRFVSDNFETALDLEPAQRETWLTLLERRDPDLAVALRAMLAEHARVGEAHFLVDAQDRSPQPHDTPPPLQQRTRPSPTESREPRPRIDRIGGADDQESSADQ